MTAANFSPSVELVRGYEGGFVNLPKDPGGATNFGITEYALSQHLGRPCGVADVKALGWPEAEAIYHSTYWPDVKADVLPSGLDLFIFDSGVNCGRGTAVQFLQRALGIADDGVFGPGTAHALNEIKSLTSLVNKVYLARATYYRSLRTYPTFGKGWMARLAAVSHTSYGWALSGQEKAA